MNLKVYCQDHEESQEMDELLIESWYISRIIFGFIVGTIYISYFLNWGLSDP